MGVVHLNTDVIGKSSPRHIEFSKPSQDILQTGGRPEVLLLKSKKFTLVHVIVGIEDLSDVADLTRGVDTGFVISSIERIEVKARDRGGFPETNVGTILGGIAGDRSIVSDSVALHTSAPDSLVGVGNIFDVSVESNRVSDIVSSDLPRLISARQYRDTYVFSVKPWIRCLKLFS